MTLNRKQFTYEIAGRDLTLEVSDLASQTNGAVLATYGGTTVLATVVMDKEDQDMDYFPLRVDYEEKFYAAGKILGSRFIRREGRPSEEAVLSGRLVDRVLRPLFDQRIRRSVQVVLTVLSYDGESDPDFVSLMAASTAISISDIPWRGPAAGVRVSKIGGKSLLNAQNSEVAQINPGDFDAFVCGTADKINMIEFGGYEIDEEEALGACAVALAEFAGLVELQNKIAGEIGKEKVSLELKSAPEEMVSKAKEFLADKLEAAVYVSDKKNREDNVSGLIKQLKDHLAENGFDEGDLRHAADIVDEAVNEMVHRFALEQDRRPDGRALDEVRPLYGEVGLLPRMHGSGLFTRGDTQALAVTTLGSPGDEQLIETIEFSGKQRFMLHYNFPPFSVGEARSFRGPGRRDIGHGALAQKAIKPLIPTVEEFPYTIRVVSEILSSNGSSSMATVSASSMSLMDAGVPLKKPVAGIAMGLILGEGGKYKVLTDIQGPEDHHGDMDFKVAGTADGVNAIQLDVKIDGLTVDMARDALAAAKKARAQVLAATNTVIAEPRADISQYAPRILTTHISPDRIGELIGPGGKVINKLIEETGVDSIDIEDDGIVMVTTTDAAKGNDAIARINAMMKEFEVGEVVEGDVIKLLDFGAIVDLGGGKDGMVHISEIKEGYVENIKDAINLGDHVRAEVISAENGKIGLSIKKLKEDK